MGKIKRVAGKTEDQLIVRIKLVVGIAIVAVEPQTIGIVLDVEKLEVAVRVGYV